MTFSQWLLCENKRKGKKGVMGVADLKKCLTAEQLTLSVFRLSFTDQLPE